MYKRNADQSPGLRAGILVRHKSRLRSEVKSGCDASGTHPGAPGILRAEYSWSEVAARRIVGARSDLQSGGRRPVDLHFAAVTGNRPAR